MRQVKELRERTQAGLNDCRAALVEAQGDMEAAVQVILKKGLAKSAKRAGALATEGIVATRVAADGRSGVIVEVNIQTDFAARNQDFLAFVEDVVATAAKSEAGSDLGAAKAPNGQGTLEDQRQALVGKLGENITIRRWDTPDHAFGNGHRCDPTGRSYRPFHDVQALVDGEAARALARLVRDRWQRAECGELPGSVGVSHECWPDSIQPDFLDVDVGIARTQPACKGTAEIREVERLFMDMIDAAERSIYVENQFMTSRSIAERLAQRLRRNRNLEAVLVAPNTPESWLEAHTMRNGRVRFRDGYLDLALSGGVRFVERLEIEPFGRRDHVGRHGDERQGRQKAQILVQSVAIGLG